MVSSARIVLVISLVVGSGVVGLGATTPAAAAGTCKATNTSSGETRGNLQRAIKAADAGDRIRVVGVCTGSFVVRKDLTIVGKSTDRYPRPSLVGPGRGRVLTLEGAHALTLDSLVVRGGKAREGGGLHNASGELTLVDTVVRANEAGRRGSAIYNGGTLRLRGATAIKNHREPEVSGTVYNKRGDVIASGSVTISG